MILLALHIFHKLFVKINYHAHPANLNFDFWKQVLFLFINKHYKVHDKIICALRKIC